MKAQVLAAALVCALSSPVAAQIMPGMPLSTQTYRQMAAASDMFEIESSRLALQMSRNPRVRAFAQEMVRDHTMTTQALMGGGGAAGAAPGLVTGAVIGGVVAGPVGAAVGAGVGATSGAAGAMRVADPRHAAMLNQLAATRGAQFDRLYGQMQRAAHDEAIALHGSYAQAGADPGHRAFAQQVLPHLQHHRAMAARLPGGRR